MKRHALDSDFLKSVGYDPATRTLQIRFSDSTIFNFFDVPLHVSTALQNAPSPGKYWNTQRDKFKYRQVR